MLLLLLWLFGQASMLAWSLEQALQADALATSWRRHLLLLLVLLLMLGNTETQRLCEVNRGQACRRILQLVARANLDSKALHPCWWWNRQVHHRCRGGLSSLQVLCNSVLL